MSDAEEGLDALHRAIRYLCSQWNISMVRDEAQANLHARAILFNCSNLILKEFGMYISLEELEGAAIIERELNG